MSYGKSKNPVRGEQLRQSREEASDGRLHRELSARTIVPPEFADAIWRNPDNILGMPYLVRDIQGFKDVLKALKKTSTSNPDAVKLHQKLTLLRPGAEFTSPLCPIARHVRKREMQRGLAPFLFQNVHNQISLETIIHGVSPTLTGSLDVISDAITDLRTVRSEMKRQRTGYLEVGTFEPDIRHVDDFHGGMPSLTRLASELGWEVPDTGGYVISSHRLVRVAKPWVYMSVLRKQFPGYHRIRSDKLDQNETLSSNLDRIIDYIWKLSPHVAAIQHLPYKDCPHIMQSVFAGPTATGRTDKRYVFETMITQWALFLDSVGFAKFEINYINQYSYDWHSEDEINFYIESGWYDEIHGYSKPEPTRSKIAYKNRLDNRSGQAIPKPRSKPKPHRLKSSFDDPTVVPLPEVFAQVAGQPVLRVRV